MQDQLESNLLAMLPAALAVAIIGLACGCPVTWITKLFIVMLAG